MTHRCPQFWRFKKEFTLHTVDFETSEQIKPLQPVGQAKEFNLSPSSNPCRSSGNRSRRLFQKSFEGFDCKIKCRALLGPRSGTSWAGRTGEHKCRAFPSRRQSLQAATGSLEENVLVPVGGISNLCLQFYNFVITVFLSGSGRRNRCSGTYPHLLRYIMPCVSFVGEN